MTARFTPPAFPQALDNDDDDVAWALQTAAVQWKRGAHGDAVEWLSKAVEAAVDAAAVERAREIQQQTNALEAALKAGWAPTPSVLPEGPGSARPGAFPAPEAPLPRFSSVPPAAGEDYDDGAEPIARESYEPEARQVLDSIPVEIESFRPEERDQAAARRASEPELLEEAEVLDEEFDAADIEALAAGDGDRISIEPEEVSAVELEAPEETSEEPGRAPSDAPPSGGEDVDSLLALSGAPPEPPPEPPQDEASEELPTLNPPPVTEALPPEPEEPPVRAAEPEPAPTAAEIEPETVEPPEAVPAEPPEPSGPAEVGGILLAEVRGLEDLPDESQAMLAQKVEIHLLDPDEEVGGFGLALVLEGQVLVMPAVADVAAAMVEPGDLVFGYGHLDDGVALRVIAGPDGARVATWPAQEFEQAIEECPWVGDELKTVGDRYQALAGVAMGKMGEHLDDTLRGMVIERCEVRRLLPGEVIAEAGKPVQGMIVVGAGRLQVVEPKEGGNVLEELGPGDFLFASQILQAASAPATARAGEGGALILFAPRMAAHELMVSVPPLLEIFAS